MHRQEPTGNFNSSFSVLLMEKPKILTVQLFRGKWINAEPNTGLLAILIKQRVRYIYICNVVEMNIIQAERHH